MTAALPLSHTSLMRVRTTPLPEGGTGRCTSISWLPCTTWLSAMSTPGIATEGGSVSWRVGTTTPNDGSTWRSSFSVVNRSVAGATLSPSRAPKPMPRW
jgi:hypothetical protein